MTGFFKLNRGLRIGVIIAAILYCIITFSWLHSYWTYIFESITRIKTLLGWVGLAPYVVGLILIWLWPWGVGLAVFSYKKIVVRYLVVNRSDKQTDAEILKGKH